MSLRALCGASFAHDASVHEPNACPSPSKREFEVIMFSDRQYHNSFIIYLVNRVVEGHISRDILVYLDIYFEEL